MHNYNVIMYSIANLVVGAEPREALKPTPGEMPWVAAEPSSVLEPWRIAVEPSSAEMPWEAAEPSSVLEPRSTAVEPSSTTRALTS